MRIADPMTSRGFEDVRMATVNGIALAFREHGSGEPVVFVHGGVSDLRTWEQQLPAVGRSYRAITYSRRFARPNADITPGADDQMLPHVEDLAAFLRVVDAVPAHLAGNSWGAFICLLTALRYPDVVRTLVVEEPPVLPLLRLGTPPRPMELLRLFAARPRTAIAVLRFGAATIAPAQRAFQRGENENALEIFARGVLGKEAFERLPEARKEQMRNNLSALHAQMLGAGFPALAENDVRGIRVPVLLVTGQHSPSVFLRLTDRLEELLPIVERVEIPGASHVMHEENAAAVNEASLGFLARHRDLPPPPAVA
jgi:pimeloyl-ACP methyl ester carboxylesterase